MWLQALALIALAVAASGPMRQSPMSDAALVIDVSPSMGARDSGVTRLELARRAAKTWLGQRPSRETISLIVAGSQAISLGAFRAGDPAIDSALAALTPGVAPADFVRAVSAAELATRGAIAIVSDAPSTRRAGRTSVDWRQVGTPLDNVGIVSLRSGGAGRALVEAQNFGTAPQRIVLTLERDQREIWRQPLTIDAAAVRAFRPAIPDGTTVVTAQLRVEDANGDALESDNTRSADVTPRPPVRVLLVTTGNRFLEQALRALPDVALSVVASLPASLTSRDDVIVCDGCAAAPRRPSLWLPPAASGSSAQGDVAIATLRADHPLMRGVDFADARVVPAPALSAPPSVLATAAGRPLLAADESPAGREVLLAADLSQSSLPLTVAFPVFIANAVEWLSARSPEGLNRADADAIAESDLRAPVAASLDALPGPAPQPANPWMAVVASIALLLVAVEWAWRRARPWPRAFAAVLIVAAIAGARIPGGAAGRTIVFALDGSGSVASVRRAALARVWAEMGRMSPGDRAGLVVFGEHGDLLRDPDSSRPFESVTLPPPSAVTNIAAGIRAAGQTLPEAGDRRIVLMSDGQPTTGDTLAAADDSRTPIDVVALDDRSTVVIRRLDAPVESRAGVAIPLSAELDGPPGARISIDLVRDGSTIDTRQVTLSASGRGVTTWTDTPPHAGVVFYRAAAMDPRVGVVVSEAGAGVTVGGRGRVLVITARPGDVASRVRSAEVDVEERAAATVPDTRAAFAPFSAIVLDAIAPHRLNARQLNAISDAVTLDGAGLLVLGDRESLNASEFTPSRFTDSLPIDFTTMPRPPSASMALALLVDTSGSMASTSDGVTKISAARDAVARALAVLPPSDAVQVLGFAATPTVLVPAGDPRDPASIAERLRQMAPSGGTALTPALTQAVTWLRGLSNPVKRVLLVSDGRTTPADAEAAKAAVSGQGIEVSVVAIGSDADRAWLTSFARSTGGRAYFPDTLRELPGNVAREAARGAGGREVDERFRVRAGAHPLAPLSMPELGGYVAGQLRPGATAAWKSPTEDPVLAAWPHGLGRVAVFASDRRGSWGAPMASWRDAGAFWRRAVMWLARANDIGRADAQLETTAAGTRLVVDAGEAVDRESLPSIFASVLTPSGATIAVPLHAVTSGRAETDIALSETGDYSATIVISDPQTGDSARFMRGWFWSGDQEAQARGVNETLLPQIAARSGGVVRAPGSAPAPGAGVFDGARTRTAREAAIGLLLLAAALLFWDYLQTLSREAHR